MFHGKIDHSTAVGLKELRKRIKAANIPPSQLDKSINIATWNIREFGKKRRLKQSLHYIAEVIGQFDLVAITEVRRNLRDLNEVMRILGPYWKVVFSDYTYDRGGNNERMAYLYDKRAVVFTGLAAEADAKRKKNKQTGEYETEFDWWRPPYIASFSAGSYDFIALTVHIKWGKKEQERINELKLLADWVHRKANDRYGTDKDIIVMGDFNIPKIGDKLFNAITSKGLKIPESLAKATYGSNLSKNKRYDQILYQPHYEELFTNHGGVLDFHIKDPEISKLYPNKNLSKLDYTYQMSDHLPLWVQINTDLMDQKLDQIINK